MENKNNCLNQTSYTISCYKIFNIFIFIIIKIFSIIFLFGIVLFSSWKYLHFRIHTKSTPKESESSGGKNWNISDPHGRCRRRFATQPYHSISRATTRACAPLQFPSLVVSALTLSLSLSLRTRRERKTVHRPTHALRFLTWLWFCPFFNNNVRRHFLFPSRPLN